MRKFISGVIIGALLFGAVPVLAEQASRVGKKVGSEATVFLDGQQIENAIVVDSKGYAPVREIAEAFDAKVEWESGVININSNGNKENTELKKLNVERAALIREIESVKQAIAYMESEDGIIAKIENNMSNGVAGTTAYETTKEKLEMHKQELAGYKEKLPKLEKELVELDKKLNELN
jgi:chromosome segregation ATPase